MKIRRTIEMLGIAIFVASLSLPSKANETSSSWSAEDRAATAHVLALAEGRPNITLDLSDPKVAHFLKRHYESSGLTEERYPGLHQLMRTYQQIHAVDGVQSATETVDGDLVYSDLATLVLAIYPTATTTFEATSAATMEAAPDDPSQTLQLAYASLCFYDENNNQIGTCNTQTSFGSGQYFPINQSVTTSDQTFNASLAATYYDETDKRYVAQFATRQLNTLAYPQSQTISDPVIVHPSNNNLKTALVCTSRSVNANANPGTCDYGTFQNTDVLVTMEGSVTYAPGQTPKTNAQGQLVGTGSVSLLNTIQGGGCSLSPSISGADFFDQPEVAYSGATNTVSWNFDNLDFGDAPHLICGGDGTAIQFALTLQVEDETNPDLTYSASQTSVTNTITPHFLGNAGAMATPMLRLVAGCLHPDTEILAADGVSSLRLSTIRGEGEPLLSGANDMVRVVGTVDGEESTMFVIRAGQRSITASAMHPFVLSDHTWRAAEDLRVGDAVLSDQGPVLITSIEKVAYDGPVHNLVLENTAQPVSVDTHSFFANGFLVGDHDTQQMLAAARWNKPKDILNNLPKGFEIDFRSHLEDNGLVAEDDDPLDSTIKGFAVDHQGNLGVGTSDPEHLLHVDGNSYAEGLFMGGGIDGQFGTSAVISGFDVRYGQRPFVLSYGGTGVDPQSIQIHAISPVDPGQTVFKTFIIDHPTKTDRHLVHAAIEGPEGAVYYRGSARLRDGFATVELPDYFEALTSKTHRTIQLSNIDGFDRLAVKSQDGAKIVNGSFVVMAESAQSNQWFDWQVMALRADGDLVIEPRKGSIQVKGNGPYTYARPVTESQ